MLTLTGLLQVAVAGPIKVAIAQSGQVDLPPDFQYYTPEQQAQFYQAQQATQGPVFIYAFPAILSVLGVWAGWLAVGGVLHLVLTLLGSRDSTAGALNLVAWACVPYAVRDLVRAGFMLVTRQMVSNPGLTGFAPAGDGMGAAVVAEALKVSDLYGLWYILLLIAGVRAGGGLSAGKAALGVLITVLVTLVLVVSPGVAASQFGSLNLIRPFFF